jgi:cAMP-binding proteins - catabolite gene activator and regulatory subunit of cAMP-dependent protein kinases
MDASLLHAHPFMRMLTREQAERLVPCAREVAFADNVLIFREGAPADTSYLICDGSVALEVHIPGRDAVQVESLHDGDVLGLSWLFPSAQWTLDARSVGRVRAFALRADCLLEQMNKDPVLEAAVLAHMVQALYQRLQRVRLQRLDVYSKGV